MILNTEKEVVGLLQLMDNKNNKEFFYVKVFLLFT